MSRESFVFYRDWAELRKKFPRLAGKLINAIIDYGIYGIEPEDEEISFCFELVKGQIDRDRMKYEEIIEKRRSAGKKGGAPKGNRNASKQPNQEEQANQANACFDKQNNQMQAKQAKQADNDNDNVNDNVNVNVNDNDNGKSTTSIMITATEAETDLPRIKIHPGDAISIEEGIKHLRAHFEWKESVARTLGIGSVTEVEQLLERFSNDMTSSMLPGFTSYRGAANLFKKWYKEIKDGDNRKSRYELGRERGDAAFLQSIEKDLRGAGML